MPKMIDSGTPSTIDPITIPERAGGALASEYLVHVVLRDDEDTGACRVSAHRPVVRKGSAPSEASVRLIVRLLSRLAG
jgi:hypothetical protein